MEMDTSVQAIAYELASNLEGEIDRLLEDLGGGLSGIGDSIEFFEENFGGDESELEVSLAASRSEQAKQTLQELVVRLKQRQRICELLKVSV